MATFSYQDAAGVERYQIRRFEPKGFQIWHKNKGGEYIPGLGEEKPIPYRLPELQQPIKYSPSILSSINYPVFCFHYLATNKYSLDNCNDIERASCMNALKTLGSNA